MDTKKMLTEAFYRLVLKKPVEQITVELIMEESGLSRSTFYRHFSDKYDVMNAYLKRYFDALNYDPEQDSWAKLTYNILAFIKEHPVFFKNIQQVGGQNSFNQFLLDYCMDLTAKTYLFHTGKSELTYEERGAIIYTCAGSNAVTFEWLNSDFEENVDAVAHVIYQNRAPLIASYLQ